MSSYKELTVWQRSIDLVAEIYTITTTFPPEEKFGLISQMRRSAVSIPSNIAEGHRRNSRKTYKHFLSVAYGSGAELETQIEIAKKLPFGSKIEFRNVDFLLLQVMKMLNVMVKRLE